MSESGEGGGEKEKKPKPALVRLKNKTSSGGGSLSSPLASGGNKLGGGRALGVTPLNRSGSGGGGGASLFSSPNRTSGLQSFKPKRDLTLGSSGVKGVAGSPAAITPLKSVTSASMTAPKSLERKKFVPNLNVTRQIKKENNADAASHATNGGGGKRRRDNNKFERREKNSRDRPALIQTDSIFSEGVGGDPLRRRFAGVSYRDGGDGGGPEASAMLKPKLELGKTCDKEEEERKLKLILSGDFIDDLKHGSFLPIQLPMIDTGKIFKSEEKQEVNDPDEIRPRLLNKKRSELDSDDDDDIDDPHHHPALAPSEQPVINNQDNLLGHIPPVADVLKKSSSQLIFFQLPDNLPVRLSADVDQNTDGTLTGVEGRLGELQIRKSGAVQLVLGGRSSTGAATSQGNGTGEGQKKLVQKFDVEVGTQVGFLQDLVSIRVPPMPEQDGEMTVLGHITNRLIVSPNWDSLLQESGYDQDLA